MKYKGTFTIEAAVLVPLLFVVCGFLLHVLFYYHDKNIVVAAVHETLSDACGREVMDEEMLESQLHECIHNKTLLLSEIQTDVTIENMDVKVCCAAEKNLWKLQIESVTKKTTPEVYIRSVRKIRKLEEEN